MTKPLNIKALLPLGIFLAFAILFAIGLTRDPAQLPSEMIDRPFPDFNLSTLDDPDNVLTESLLQGEVTLVNIFGSWCVACVQEHPKLVSLSKRDDIRLIGVDWRDSREKATRWLNRYGNPYAVVLFDDTSQLAIDLGVTGAPETFVVDKAGKIRYKHVGIITDEVWRSTLYPLVKNLRMEK